MIIPFVNLNADPVIRGFLHVPTRGGVAASFGDDKREGKKQGSKDQSLQGSWDVVVLTHGAGADCQSRLLVEMADALAAGGFTVLRFDLPFRQLRPHGPPSFGGAARDRDGLRRAVAIMREKTHGSVFLGGHSYGGRQATMLVSEEPELAEGLLLLSYPLHPPKKPAELRTGHFSKLTKPAFFVHGSRDPFGTIAEMQAAVKLIPGSHALFEVEGVGHDLLSRKAAGELPTRIVEEFQAFLKSGT
jgi:predicted alpha/beta-hydrolase family hydrolase